MHIPTVVMTRNARDTMCPLKYGRKYMYVAVVYWSELHHNCKYITLTRSC